MIGKASLLLVLSFGLIFTVAGFNFNSLSSRAVDNDVNYFEATVAHNIAIAGANMASNEIYLDNSWMDGYSDLPFSGGTIDVTVQHSGLNISLVSTGTFHNVTRTVKIGLQPSSFAKFAYYMNIFPGNTYFYTGDTVTGPFHTQGKLNLLGRPVFQGKVSAKNGIKLMDKNTDPKFYGGYESGVDIPLAWSTVDVKAAAATSGHVFAAPAGKSIDVNLTFNANGTLTYSKKNDGGTWSADTTVALNTFAPNGVLFVDKGNVHMKGTVSGSYTVVVDQSSGNGTGNVYIQDNILYKNDPLVNPNSTDKLGIVCSNNILIDNNAANRDNVTIDASIFSYKGGLGMADQSMPPSGTLKVFGGVIEYQAQITGIVNNSGNITHGYHERVIFDERLMLTSPPYFPITGNYEIVSWME